ncbi:MAG: hypothetical protein ACRDRH_13450 [Pseudonocardia sp.]
MIVALWAADQQPRCGAPAYMPISDPHEFPGPSYPLDRSEHFAQAFGAPIERAAATAYGDTVGELLAVRALPVGAR